MIYIASDHAGFTYKEELKKFRRDTQAQRDLQDAIAASGVVSDNLQAAQSLMGG